MEQLPNIIEEMPEKIVVLGDIHGDYEVTLDLLKKLKLIHIKNNKIEWIGGNTYIVQLGDQVDNCRIIVNPDTKQILRSNEHKKNYIHFPCIFSGENIEGTNDEIKVLNLFTYLHKLAKEKGGAVYSLIGNHELMNKNVADINYVSPKALMEFGIVTYDEKKNELVQRNEEICTNIEKYSREYVTCLKNHRRTQFHEIYKFIAKNRYPMLVIGPYLFIHGGITQNFIDYAKELMKKEKGHIIDSNTFIKLLNKYIILFILDKSEEYSDLFNYGVKLEKYDRTVGNQSIFWTRFFSKIKKTRNKEKKCEEITNILEFFSVNHIIVGHTVMGDGKVGYECGKKIIFSDIALSRQMNFFNNNEEKEILIIHKNGELEIFKYRYNK